MLICFVCLSGVLPFRGKTDKQTISDIVNANFGGFAEPQWSKVSDLAKAFIRALLRLRPEQRLTAARALEHEWLRWEGESTRREKRKTSSAEVGAVGVEGGPLGGVEGGPGGVESGGGGKDPSRNANEGEAKKRDVYPSDDAEIREAEFVMSVVDVEDMNL